MSEPAYTRSSDPSLTAQVVLRRRQRKGDHSARLASADEASSRLRLLAKQSPPSLAPVISLGPCVYCGRNSRDMACAAHRDLLILDVGEARD